MSEERIISEEELRVNDGQDGRPAYIAYKGKVYDVSQSRLWRKGAHARRHQAGNDLSDDLAAAPHDESVFEREQIVLVGRLAGYEEEKERFSLLDWYFEQHPHGAIVHFPIATTVLAGIFLLLYLVTGNVALETGAYHLLWAVLIATPPAGLSGAVSWWFNYGHRFTPTFQAKIGLGWALLLLDAIALFLRAGHPDILVRRTARGWLYLVVVLVMLVLVAVLGRIGAKILFPPRRR